MSDPEASKKLEGASPEAQSFALRLKSIAGLVTAITALIVALAGLITTALKKYEEVAAKAGYEKLSTAVEATNAEIDQNRQDLVNLRDYLDKYFKAQADFLSRLPTALQETLPASTGTPSTRPWPTATLPPIRPPSSAIAAEPPPPPMASLNPPKPNLPDPKREPMPATSLPSFEKLKADENIE